MHNKFWIFDGQTVWTGSTNITESGIFKQNNNTIVIQIQKRLRRSTKLNSRKCGTASLTQKSPSQIEQQTTSVNGTPIQVIFTSEDHAIEQSIIPVVNTATKSIRFLAFSFTDFPLAEAMMQRAQTGVDVAGSSRKWAAIPTSRS